MGRLSELSILADEILKCSETLKGISESLAKLFSGSDEDEPKEEKTLTLEDVRAVLADKSRAGFTAEVKAILTKHGADKLSEIDPAEYKAMLDEAGVLHE